MFVIKVIDSYNGTTNPSGNQLVEEGSSITFRFAPKPGFVIDCVFVDNENIGNVSSYTFDNVTENHNIYARYIDAKKACDRVAYNRYNTIRDIGYLLISELIKNNDDIWRLLKYNTPDALTRDFLTLDEKRELIFDGITNPDSEQYRVFRQPFLDDAFEEQVTQLRCYLLSINPENRSVGTVTYAFETVCHLKIMSLANYENRLEVMVQQIMQTLNGVHVGAVGEFVFDDNSSYFDLSSMNMYNNRNFMGFTTVLSCKIGDLTGEKYYGGFFG